MLTSSLPVLLSCEPPFECSTSVIGEAGEQCASQPSNARREPRERRGGDHASHAKHVSQAPRRGGSARELAIKTAT